MGWDERGGELEGGEASGDSEQAAAVLHVQWNVIIETIFRICNIAHDLPQV